MSRDKEILEKLGYKEPLKIASGDERVLLGVSKQPPPMDVRVIAEDNYQILLAAQKETAIAFAEWINVNNVKILYWEDNIAYYSYQGNKYASADLYELFNNQ